MSASGLRLVPQEKIMKFICLGYYDEKKFNALSPSEQGAMMEGCFAYDDELSNNGHWLGGEALQPPPNAATVSSRNGKVVVTDGPYAETKELLGGIMYIEANDLQHAVELMSKHPGLKIGPFEIRAIDEQFSAMIAARHQAKSA
jgi:hypothetical protein